VPSKENPALAPSATKRRKKTLRGVVAGLGVTQGSLFLCLQVSHCCRFSGLSFFFARRFSECALCRVDKIKDNNTLTLPVRKMLSILNCRRFNYVGTAYVNAALPIFDAHDLYRATSMHQAAEISDEVIARVLQ
jgi:hypothetical protein